MPLGKNEKVELLKGIPLFAECSRAELVEVALNAGEREAPEGETLTAEGSAGTAFFVLVEGSVAVARDGTLLARLGPGDWFGELAVLRYKPRTATVTATSPVRMLVIDDRDLRRIVEATPRVASKLLRRAAQLLEQDASA